MTKASETHLSPKGLKTKRHMEVTLNIKGLGKVERLQESNVIDQRNHFLPAELIRKQLNRLKVDQIMFPAGAC